MGDRSPAAVKWSSAATRKKMIAAFFGSTARLFDLKRKVPLCEPIRNAGDGEVGFVNHKIGYTAA
jgi:hypothetical protein